MFKFSVILWLLVTGMAHASSESSLAHQNYTVKLNSMAAIVMDWYGSLLINKPHTFLKPLHTNLSEYPEQIKLIKITQTSLVSLDTFDQTQFIVEVAIKKDDLKSSKIHHLSDTFLFETKQANDIRLLKITSHFNKISDLIIDSKYTKDYYLNREVAYSWLAYLDGSKKIKNKPFDSANYELLMGAKHWKSKMLETLKHRNSLLFKGGHQLITVNNLGVDSDFKKIELMINWKGENKNGIPVIAKIRQIVTYKEDLNGLWLIQSINEKHLLPDDKPWLGLLC